MDADRARELLQAERARIERALAGAGIAGDGELSDQENPANLATDTYQAEFDEGSRDGLREQLAAVERAEARLDAGTFGVSIESGEAIPDERLELAPAAERTVAEQRTFDGR